MIGCFWWLFKRKRYRKETKEIEIEKKQNKKI
jgi:hypothetical protein